MPGLKEIRRRIQSVKNTRQITRAMKLVSAAKLKRAEEAAHAGDSFGHELEEVINGVVLGLPEGFSHPVIFSHKDTPVEGRKRCVIAISGDRGLCGAYNGNIIKFILANEDTANKDVRFIPVGRRVASVARKGNWNIDIAYEGLPENISHYPIDEIVNKMFEEFKSKTCDELSIYYTKHISGLTQVTTKEVLLPIDPAKFFTTSDTEIATVNIKKYKYEQNPEQLFHELLPLYVKAKIRSAALSAKASEHASRMAAMDSATNNADDLIAGLQLFYNRARQNAITRDLIDIVGGAEAVG